MRWNPCLQELVGEVEPLLTGTCGCGGTLFTGTCGCGGTLFTGTCGCGGTFAYRNLWVRWNPCLQELVGEVEPLLTGACG